VFIEKREVAQAFFEKKLFTSCSRFSDFMNYRAASL